LITGGVLARATTATPPTATQAHQHGTFSVTAVRLEVEQ
jgi:hypothetical protein